MAFGMVGCSSGDNQSALNSSSAQTQSSSAQSQTQASSASTDAPAIDGVDISEQEALKIALNNAGLKESQIQMVKNELDVDGGVTIYEIDFVGPNNMEYEYEISATTGDILSYESEPMD